MRGKYGPINGRKSLMVVLAQAKVRLVVGTLNAGYIRLEVTANLVSGPRHRPFVLALAVLTRRCILVTGPEAASRQRGSVGSAAKW